MTADGESRVEPEAVLAAARAAVRDEPTVDRDSRELGPGIDGVEVRRLTVHADPRGILTPVIDVRDPFWNEPIVYAYRFSILPGRIKGWGMHDHQTDRYFVVSGSVRVALFDGREDSPTAGSIVRVDFTDRTPGLVKIPPGSGTPTRTGARTRRTSSTSRLVRTIRTTRTSTGSTRTAARFRSTGRFATASRPGPG
jgi:dTDP-4-dehydrorhamnose 3,5-epimerase